MEKEYLSINELEKDITEGILTVETIHNIVLNNRVKSIPLPQRIIALKMIHQFIKDKHLNELDVLHKAKPFINKKFDIFYSPCEAFLNEKIDWMGKRINFLNNLTHLYNNDTLLPFEKNKSYKVKDWDNSYFYETGRSTEQQINSKACIIVENSLFENEFNTFILNITSEPFAKDSSRIPFVFVKVSYGKFKGFGVYLRTDKIVL